jgi:hypothetical protein
MEMLLNFILNLVDQYLLIKNFITNYNFPTITINEPSNLKLQGK